MAKRTDIKKVLIIGSGPIVIGQVAEFDYAGTNLALWDLNAEYEIDPNDFISMGRATPFEGWKVRGKCVETLYRGNTVWQMA